MTEPESRQLRAGDLLYTDYQVGSRHHGQVIAVDEEGVTIDWPTFGGVGKIPHDVMHVFELSRGESGNPDDEPHDPRGM